MTQTLCGPKLAVLLILIETCIAQPTPTYCWTLTSNTGSIPDSCGSSYSLTRQLGGGLGPFCDASGCSFESDSRFSLDLSSMSLSTTWTIGVWATLTHSRSQTLFEIENINGAPSLIQVERLPSALKSITGGQATQQDIANEWGSQEWVFIYANSGNSFTQIGTYYRSTFYSFNINAEINLSSASTLSIGNNAAGSAPVRLIKRLEIYDGVAYTTSTAPYTLSDVLSNQPCMVLQAGFFCQEAYIYYKMNPSYLDQEQVTDSSGFGYHAVNGVDLTQSKNALSLQKGLRFYGDDLVTASTVSVSAYSFTISMWFLLNSGFESTLQTLFKEDAGNLIIQIQQSTSLLRAKFPSSNVQLQNGIFDTNDYNLVTVSVSPASATSKYVLLSLNGNFAQGEVTSSHFPITSFQLGENFQGTMRQFSIFKHFMGFQSFNSLNSSTQCLKLVSKICNSKFFFNQATKQCQGKDQSSIACHSSCSDCRDQTNTLCGQCVAGAISENAHSPGLCDLFEGDCDIACKVCFGPDPDQCNQCSQGHYKTGTFSPTCVEDCTTVHSFAQPVNGICTIQPVQIYLTHSFIEPIFPVTLFFTFSQFVLLNDFSLDNIKFDFQNTKNSGFKPVLVTNTAGFTQTLQIELHPQSSLKGDQTVKVEILVDSGISTSSQYFTLPSSFHSQALRLPHYESKQEYIYKGTQIARQFLGGGATSAFMAISISQCFIQVSLDPFWILINADQLLYFSPLVSIKLPTTTLILFNILSFAMGDLTAFEQLYMNTFGRLIPPTEYQSRSQNYELIGYDSIGLLDAAGILVMMFCFQVILLLGFYFLKLLLFFIRGFQIFVNKAIDAIRRALTRTFLQGFLQLYLFSLLNLQHIKFTSLPYIVSGVFSIIFAILLTYIPFAFLSILTLPDQALTNKASPVYRRCRVLYEGINFRGSLGARFYTVFFLIRRQVIVFSLVFLKQCGKVQTGIKIGLSMIEILILARHKPFLQKIDNRVSLMNESLLLLVYLLFLLITIYSEDEDAGTRSLLGSITVSIAIALNVVNILVMLVHKSKECKKKCRKQKPASLKYIHKQASLPLEEGGSPSKNLETTKHTQNESISQLGINLSTSLNFFDKGFHQFQHHTARFDKHPVLATVRQMPVESEHQSDVEVQDL